MLKEEYKIYEEKMKKSIESVVNDFDTVPHVFFQIHILLNPEFLIHLIFRLCQFFQVILFQIHPYQSCPLFILMPN